MKILKETFFERLRSRMGPASAIKAIAQVQRAARREQIDYMTIKEASEIVQHYKLQARCAIRSYRRWTDRQATSSILEDLVAEKGRLLRDTARSQTSLYQKAKRDYLELVDLALKPYRDADFQPANQR